MTYFCIFCLTEAIDVDDWFNKISQSHGKIAIIESICPWCVKQIKDEQNVKRTLRDD